MLPFCNLQKGTIFFRTTKSSLVRSLKFSEIYLTWFLWDCKCNAQKWSGSEDNDKDGRHLLVSYLLASRKKIASSNTKDRIKWVICGATVLFWLHLDSQSFRIVWKFYLSAAPWCKQTIKLLVNYLTSGSFLLFINNYC